MSKDAPRLTKQSLRDRAKNEGRNVDRTYRDVALHQLEDRIDARFPGSFVVKGGRALIARGLTSRATTDLDLRGDYTESRAAVEAILGAADFDLGDGFTFTLAAEPKPLSLAQTGRGMGFEVGFDVSVAGESLTHVSVDVVTAREPTGKVRVVAQAPPVDHPALRTVRLLVYPLEDHIADKVCAMHERHGSMNRASERVKDLYDLCLSARSADLDAATLGEALEQEFLRRELPAIRAIAPPVDWQARWPKVHRGFGDESQVPADYAEALALAQRLVDPVLDHRVTAGTWDPARERWS